LVDLAQHAGALLRLRLEPRAGRGKELLRREVGAADRDPQDPGQGEDRQGGEAPAQFHRSTSGTFVAAPDVPVAGRRTRDGERQESVTAHLVEEGGAVDAER